MVSSNSAKRVINWIEFNFSVCEIDGFQLCLKSEKGWLFKICALVEKLWCYPVFRAKIIHISREKNEIDLRTCFNQLPQLSFYIRHWVCVLAILGFSHFSYLNILISEIVFIFIFFLEENECLYSFIWFCIFVAWTFFF